MLTLHIPLGSYRSLPTRLREAQAIRGGPVHGPSWAFHLAQLSNRHVSGGPVWGVDLSIPAIPASEGHVSLSWGPRRYRAENGPHSPFPGVIPGIYELNKWRLFSTTKFGVVCYAVMATGIRAYFLSDAVWSHGNGTGWFIQKCTASKTQTLNNSPSPPLFFLEGGEILEVQIFFQMSIQWFETKHGYLKLKGCYKH